MALTSRSGDFDYDVCLSFAGEDREFVERVAAQLKARGVRVFYDEYQRVELWGKDLYAHLDDVYRYAARYCVVFVSTHYADKLWTNHERQSAQTRALRENREYILPARFDDTIVPGLRETIGYIDLRTLSPEVFAGLVVEKIGAICKENYLPPIPDKVFANLGVEDENGTEIIRAQIFDFFHALQRTTEQERCIIFSIFCHGCPADLPDNVHINIDLLRRLTGYR